MDKKAKALLQYKKEDIVEALSRWDFGYHIIPNILHDLYMKRLHELHKETDIALHAASEAFQRYIEWQKNMIKKYGDGERVSLADVPQKDMDEWLRLEKEWKDKEKKHDIASSRFHKFCDQEDTK